MRRASRRKYHYFYKTICIITNRYYYGIHSTDNLNDGYIGSGKRLWYSINKHGRENHKLEILEFFDTRQKLKEKEIEVVNKDLLKDPLCMNLQPGGGGGFINEEHKFKASHNGGVSSQKVLWKKYFEDEEYRLYRIECLTKGLRKKYDSGWRGSFYLKHHSRKSKNKIGISNSISQKGEKNSQYNTHWITDGKQNKKIHNGDIVPNGWKLGRKM